MIQPPLFPLLAKEGIKWEVTKNFIT